MRLLQCENTIILRVDHIPDGIITFHGSDCKSYVHYLYTGNKRMSTLCCLWSDWHIGECISKIEISGINEFSPAIASRRVKQLISSTKKYIQTISPSSVYIMGLGDYISGNIHSELLEGSTQGVVEQVEFAGDLIGSAYTEISECTDRPVHFYGLATDNHGRLEKKPRYKGRYKSNLSYLTLQYAKSIIPKDSRKTFHILPQIAVTIPCRDVNILITHGDQIKTYTGIPYYGIERFYSRELIKCHRGQRKLFDYVCMGHFHSPTLLNRNLIINGSLVGISEYGAAKGYYSEPCQLLLLFEKHALAQLTLISLN